MNKLFKMTLILVCCAMLFSGCGSSMDGTSMAESSIAASESTIAAGTRDNNQEGDLQVKDSGTTTNVIIPQNDIRIDFSDVGDTERQQNTVNDSKTSSNRDTLFKDYGVNPFIDSQESRFSTFALDVDTASYTKAKSYIESGSLPPKDSVRVEEFINYFKRSYPQPSSDDKFSIYTEMAPSAFNRGYHVLEVGIQGKNIEAGMMKDTCLTFVIDVSGSMDMDNRLGLVKKSLKVLIGQMGRNDKIGIAVYGTNGRKLLKHTSAANKEEILSAISELTPEGSTNAAEGLQIGYKMAAEAFIPEGNNRIILCTDGLANEGLTDAEQILKSVKEYKQKGITLTTLGFGMDNYNDIFLEKLADNGDGNYAYINDMDEAERVLQNQMVSTLQIIAKDAKAQIEFDSDTVKSYRLIGYENRVLNKEDFRDNSVDAGEIGAGHAVTALYEIKLKENTTDNVGTVRLRYKDVDNNKVKEVSKDIKTSSICDNFYNATPRFRFLNMVSQTAEILRGSPWASNTKLEDVYKILTKNMDGLQMTKEDMGFVEMVKTAMNID